MKSGIYKITNKINNKVYIGQSNNIKERIKVHKSSLRGGYHHNSYLQRSWNKYGEENFVFEILELCELEIIDDREKHWISLYDSTSEQNGYNFESGGNANKIISEKSIEKMRQAKIGRFKGEDNPNSKQVICLETMVIYVSVAEASKDIGCHFNDISQCCRGKSNTSHNLHWMFYDEYKLKTKEEIRYTLSKKPNNLNSKIICTTTNEIFENLDEVISRHDNLIKSNIIACCRGRRKRTGGLEWKYV